MFAMGEYLTIFTQNLLIFLSRSDPNCQSLQIFKTGFRYLHQIVYISRALC
jgi:hypothetical protein